jgi:hypothetical protein
VDGPAREVMDMEPLGDRYRAFGWDVVECDGNDKASVAAGLGRLCAPGATRPGMLVGRTVRLRTGRDVALVCSGLMLEPTLAAVAEPAGERLAVPVERVGIRDTSRYPDRRSTCSPGTG